MLGPLEETLLEHLWRIGEGEVTDLHRKVPNTSMNTVGSAVERLYRKGLLTRERISHAYRYKPAVTRGEFLARRLAQGPSGIRDLPNRRLLASFLDTVTEADAQALDELEKWIAQRRRGAKL